MVIMITYGYHYSGTRGTEGSLYQVASPWHCQLIGQDRDHACTSFFSPSYPSSSSLVLEILWIVNNILFGFVTDLNDFCWDSTTVAELIISVLNGNIPPKTPQTLYMKGPSCGYQGRWRVVCYVICTTQFPLQLCEAVFASLIWQQFWSLNNICSLQALVMIHTDRRIQSRKTGSPDNPNYSHRKRQQQQQQNPLHTGLGLEVYHWHASLPPLSQTESQK